MSARTILESFTVDSIPDLDIVVAGALELCAGEDLPSLPTCQRPLVMGSAGAAAAARLAFSGYEGAVFVDENTYLPALRSADTYDAVIIVSASGSKHAVAMAHAAHESGLPTWLVTNTHNSPAAEYIAPEHELVLPKNREPYTYNTSTYLSLLLAATGEDPRTIQAQVTDLTSSALRRDLASYTNYTFIVPAEYESLASLVRVKFEEMFEPLVHGRAYTEETIKHAKTVIQGGDELFIAVGVENHHHGLPKNRLTITPPAEVQAGFYMALSYSIVGKIQAAHPPYFKNSLVAYTKRAAEMLVTPLTL